MNRFEALCAAIGAVFTLALFSPALAAADIYLQIPGIPGDSPDRDHPGWIEVQSYQNEMGRGAISAGGASGRTATHEIVVTKFLDKASPKLHEAMARGTHIPKVTIELMRGSGESRVKYMQITLTDVLISRIASAAGKGPMPTEQVSLNYANEEVSYAAQTLRRPMDAMPGMQPAVQPPH